MLVELVIGRCVTGSGRIGLVMQMLVRVGAPDGLRVVLVSVEIEDLRFPMIDPHHGMKMLAHGPQCITMAVAPRPPAAALRLSCLTRKAMFTQSTRRAEEMAQG